MGIEVRFLPWISTERDGAAQLFHHWRLRALVIHTIHPAVIVHCSCHPDDELASQSIDTYCISAYVC